MAAGVRLAMASLVLLGITIWRPQLFPQAIRPWVFVLGRADPGNFRIETVEVTGNTLRFSGTTRLLSAFRDVRGEAGPEVRFSGTWAAYSLHVYPIVALGLMAAAARRWDVRRVIAAIFLALLLASLSAALDAQVNIYITAAKESNREWDRISAQFAASPANVEHVLRIQHHVNRLLHIKAALNMGGRLFVALLIGFVSSQLLNSQSKPRA